MKKLWLISAIILLGLTLVIYYNKSIKILHKSSNSFGSIWVYEKGDLRCLSFEPPEKIKQTCIDTKNPTKLILNYQGLLLSALYVTPKPKNVLLIGLGGGHLVKLLKVVVPNSKIDVVEINDEVIKVARQYFNFYTNNTIKLFHDDGVKFVAANKNNKKYDVIIIDAFTKEYVPEGFLTESFVRNARNMLSAKGVIAVNTFVGSPYYKVENQIYKSVFGSFYNLEDRNRIIIATNRKAPNFKEIRKNASKLDKVFKKIGIEKYNNLEKFVLF